MKVIDGERDGQLRKACLALMILCLLLGLFPGAAEEVPARLTLMIYMTGSDLESGASAASEELQEMIAAYPASGEINVIVMASGSKAWAFSEIAGDETSIYELRSDGLRKVRTGSLRSMGSPETLTTLLDFGYTSYPAEEYALILWDHGAGPMMGVCFDELFTSDQGMDSLTLPELASALAASPCAEKKLQWIGFDACLMACVETACAVAPYAEYMIASQDTEPASGWDYGFLRGIADDTSAEETGRRIVDLYFDSVGETLSTITLSLVDLSVIPTVEAEMNALFGSLSGAVDTDSYTALTACRIDTKALGCSSPVSYDLVDFLDLMSVYQDAGVADCGTLVDLLEQAIVYQRANARYINGLNLYYPYYNKADYTTRWGKRAAETDFSSGYRSFLQSVTSIWLGDTLADWNTGLYMESAVNASGAIVSMQLTDGQAAHFGGAEMYILEQIVPNNFRFLYMTDDIALSEDNWLETVYEGRALFIVDEDGEPITSEITYTMHDGMLLIPAALFDWNGSKLDAINVMMIFQKDEQDAYALTEIIDVTGDPLLSGRSTVRLDDWREIHFVGGGHVPAYDEAGGLLPYADWASSDWAVINTVHTDLASWRPAFLDLYSGSQRHALLQVYDNQNNVAVTKMLPISNPNITSFPVTSQVLVDNEFCLITLTGAELIAGLDPGVRLYLRVENRSEHQLSLSYDQIIVDQTLLQLHFLDSLIGVGSEDRQLDLLGKDLQRAHLEGAQTFGLRLSAQYTEYSLRGETKLFEETVTIEAPMDFTAAFTIAERGEVFGSATWNGLVLELLDLAMDEDTQLKGQLHIMNPTEEERPIYVDGCYLNDIQHAPPGLHASLPAGHEIYLDFSFKTAQSVGGSWPESVASPLTLLGVREITDLAFDVSSQFGEKKDRVVFHLTRSLPYPAGDKADWPVVYDWDGVTLRVISCMTYPEDPYHRNKRILYFCAQNVTDRDLIFEYSPYPLVMDGTMTHETYMEKRALPARTVSCFPYQYWPMDVEAVPTTFETMEVCIGLFDGAGRADELHLIIEALDVPVEETYITPIETVRAAVYNPAQLGVTASVRAPVTSQLREALGDPAE